MRISLVIPAYNEEARIGAMLDAYLPAFRDRFGDDFEFIVSVNGTTDRTADIVRARQAAYPQLRCIDDPRPIGKGGAIIAGGLQARGDLVGFVDADEDDEDAPTPAAVPVTADALRKAAAPRADDAP